MKINDIDLDIFDFKSAFEQQVQHLQAESVDSDREFNNLLLVSSTSIKYTD
jgi:hypothetical protein